MKNGFSYDVDKTREILPDIEPPKVTFEHDVSEHNGIRIGQFEERVSHKDINADTRTT